MGIGFAGDEPSAGRRFAARKTRATKIKTSPEEVNRAALPQETRAELFQDGIGGQQDSPEPMGELRFVGSMLVILFEGYRVRDFFRFGVYPFLNRHQPK